MPKRLHRSFAAVAVLALVPVLALGACSPPAATPRPTAAPIPAPTCEPLAPTAASGVSASGVPASTSPEATLFSLNPNATPIDVSSPQGVVVYADGALGQGPAHLHVVWPDKSHQGDLTPQVVAGFVVSPDGRTVEFDGVRGPNLVGSDGTKERPLPIGALTSTSFAWSPDSQWLAFHGFSQADPSVEGIYEVGIGGDCAPVRVDIAGSEHDFPIGVGPDGSILAVGDIEESSQHLEVGVIYIDRPSDRTRTRVTPSGSTSLVEDTSGPPAAWSPDGTHIAFNAAPVSADAWSAAHNGLYVVDADGTNQKELVSVGIVSGVDWQPAGGWIGTTRIDPRGVPQVYIVKLDGSKASYLTTFEAPGGCCPVWSPDGKSLLTWNGTIIPFEGSGASSLPALVGDVTYAYDWVKPKP